MFAHGWQIEQRICGRPSLPRGGSWSHEGTSHRHAPDIYAWV